MAIVTPCTELLRLLRQRLWLGLELELELGLGIGVVNVIGEVLAIDVELVVRVVAGRLKDLVVLWHWSLYILVGTLGNVMEALSGLLISLVPLTIDASSPGGLLIILQRSVLYTERLRLLCHMRMTESD